jgi:hypothetical protein
MTSRNSRQTPARIHPAKMRAARICPAQMSVTRAITKGAAPSRPFLRSDPKRLADLKIKLGDEAYMNSAILRIATVLSARLTLR